MNFLKTFWPVSFGVKQGEKSSLITRIIIYAIATVLFPVVCGIAGGLIAGILGGEMTFLLVVAVASAIAVVIDFYFIAGIVFTILRYVNVFKD